MQIVWFKRDLRVVDHAPLSRAAARGPVLPLYVVEPDWWQQSDMAGRHWAFVNDALWPLREALAQMGQPLVVKRGKVIDVLHELCTRYRIEAVWSHQETGGDWSYRRDRAVAEWLRERGIPWYQPRQQGVVRGPCDRDQWSAQWERLMNARVFAPPKALPLIACADSESIPDLPHEGLRPDYCPGRQPGGRRAGERTLESFLNERGARYHLEMSSPLSAQDSCSRLSAHLAWGTLSVREVLQATRRRRAEVKRHPAAGDQPWRRALAAFEGRLHWHCHFMQKLESEPRIEFENLHRAMDGLRDEACDDERLAAWATGQTGWPLVDACMRALHHTGWINFRMRALLMSVASYHLWLHWREPALHLARLFVDYEPGIHYSQAQMQSGTTGINTARIYNPVKQSRDQDPDGKFIRRWVPELAGVESPWIHTPWQMPYHVQQKAGCFIGKSYPAPLVDHEQAARQARALLYAQRRGAEARRESRDIFERHGSRKRNTRRSVSQTRQTRRASGDRVDYQDE